MTNTAPHTCFGCRYYLRFTPGEQKLIREQLRGIGRKAPVWGGCTYTDNKRPYLIRQYLHTPIQNCIYWEDGYYAEDIHRVCPQCRMGRLEIKRLPKNSKSFTLVACSRYPECRFSTLHLPLERYCRYCDIPLVLHTGDIMTCGCPKCKRTITVPLMLRSWPQLLRRDGICSHDEPVDSCPYCRRSLQDKVDIINLEFHYVVAKVEPERVTARASTVSQDWDDYRHGHDDYDRPSYPGSISNDYAEFLDEIASELQEYSEDAARAHEEGWFYPD